MQELLDRINDLPDDRAMEAVNLLAGDVIGATPDDEILADVAAATGVPVDQLAEAMQESSPDETAALARFTLLVYAESGDPAAVEAAIENSGKKAFVLEAALIALVSLGIAHLGLTRGRKATEQQTTVDVKADGSTSVTTRERTEYYSLGKSFAPVVAKLLGSPRT
jgi:hypothetical protein